MDVSSSLVVLFTYILGCVWSLDESYSDLLWDNVEIYGPPINKETSST